MKISTHFQRFFFGVVCAQLKQLPQPLKYQNQYNGEWYAINLTTVKDEEIYQFLKLINPMYPRKSSLLPISTTELDGKAMTRHIQWVERWAAFNGHELPYIVEEWERLIAQSR